MSTGTTLVAVEFADGVVLGADSRTSMGTYVANRVTDKLTPISSNIMACRSGSAADTQAVTDIVRYKIDFLEIERGEKVPVQTAAYLLKVNRAQYKIHRIVFHKYNMGREAGETISMSKCTEY